MDSPRGRIYLMKLAADGQAAINSQWVGHFDTCLGCMACMTACPSGVDYGKLIEATRAQIERKFDRGRLERFYRRLIFAVFTRPDRLRVLRLPLLLYQRSGLQSLVRRSGVLRLFPKRLQALEALLPQLPASEAVAEVTPAVGTKRRRVGMLLGCVQREFFPQVNAATARVLAAEGCEVVSPADQPCCGALLVHAGEEAGAMVLARHMINVFERAQVDTIVTNAAGCGSNMKGYEHLLRDDPNYAQRAKEFSLRCQDVSEVLGDMTPHAKRNPLQLRVAFHDSCHLQHAQGVRMQPRELLAAIPKLELVEIPEAPICCGSAGIYNLVQPTAANALGDRKAALIVPLDTDVVVTGNPGCILQLQASLARAGKGIPVLHTIQLLDASIRGELLSTKLR
jgi:glycolate oxidase iron-sulfur subunit